MQLLQGLAGMMFAQEVTKQLSKPGWYNPFNRSFKTIHNDNTSTIDSILMAPDNGGIVGPIIITSGAKSTPAHGQHYYSLRSSEQGWKQRYMYVGLIKVAGQSEGSQGEEKGGFRGETSSTSSSYYIIWEPRFSWCLLPLSWPKGKSPIDYFRQILKQREEGSMLTYRINSTAYHAQLYSMSIEHPIEMRNNQKIALDFIVGVYKQRFRGTFLFSGTRGTGKTTTALQLKREIERVFHETTVTLITNFDPSHGGVDISVLALRDVTREFPCVIVINEIETHMGVAASETDKSVPTTSMDEKRFRHTSDRTTFHDMLDTLAAIRYVIAIFATEKPVEELWAKQEYRSFMRKGRVHGFVRMNHKETSCEINNFMDDSPQ